MSAIRRNLTYGALSTGVTVLGGIALVPLFLHAWGPERYGQWIVLSAVPASLSLAEVGLNGAFANAYVIVRESGHGERANRLASSVWKAELCVLGAALALLILAAATLPLTQWIGSDAIAQADFAWCIGLLGMNAACSVLAGFFAAFFRATGRNAAFVAASAGFKALEVTVTAAVLLSGAGFLALCFALGAGKVVQLCWLARRARVLVPELCFSGVPFAKSDVFSLIPSGFAFFGYSFGNALVNQGAVLGVQHVLGPAAVAQFSVGRQLGRLFLQPISLVFASLHPEMNLAFARGDMRRLARLQAQALFPVIWLAPAILATVASTGPWALRIWTNGAVELSSMLAALLAAESLAYGISAIALLTAWSSNRHAAASLAFIGMQAVALGFGWWGLGFIGIAAMGFAFLIAHLIQAFVALRVTSAIAGTRAGSIWRNALVSDPWGLISKASVNR